MINLEIIARDILEARGDMPHQIIGWLGDHMRKGNITVSQFNDVYCQTMDHAHREVEKVI